MNTTPKKRTLGDDFRDYLNGKIENKYNGGVRREYVGKSDTTAIAFGKLRNNEMSNQVKKLDVVTDENGKVTLKESNANPNSLSKSTLPIDGSALPLAGDEILSTQERALNKRKSDPATVPTYEQYIQRLADTYVVQTVPSRDQIQQYNADCKMLFEAEMQDKYANADYNTLMNAANKTDKYQEKQWLKEKAQEIATSDELEEYKKSVENDTDYSGNILDGLAQTNKVREIDKNINLKRNNENLEKYKNYTFEELMNAKEQATDDEKQWLDDYAYEIGSSSDLQKEYDKLLAEYQNESKNSFDEVRYSDSEIQDFYNRLNAKDEKLKILENRIKNKKYEEDKQENYNDVILNDVKAASTLQKYYALQKAKETEELLRDTGASIENIKTSSAKYYKYVQNLSDDEKANIISDYENLKQQGYDVDNLYKYFSREQEEKLTNEQNKILNDYTEEHPVLGSAASVGLNLGGGVADAVNYIGAELDSKFNGGDGYINPQNTNVYKAQMVRDTVSKDFNGFGKFLYSTGMSMADFLSTAALSAVPGGQTVGLALLGTSAGVSAANDVIESGGDIDHAVMTGVAAGLAEAIFEKFSLEQLKAFRQGDVKVPKDFVRNLLKGSVTEGTEEAFTDLANAVTDQIINGDLSQLSRQYNNYIANGMSEREAGWQTALEFSKQTMLDFAGGALSGGVMSVGAMGINVAGKKIFENKNARQIGEIAMDSEDFDIDTLIEQAMNTDKESKAYKLGQTMLEAKNSGDSKPLFNPANIGNLIKLTTQEYEKNGNAIAKSDDKNKVKQEPKGNSATVNNASVKGGATTAKEVSIKDYARKMLKDRSVEDREAIVKLLSPFGTKNENGVMANIRVDGKIKRVMVDSIESSAHDYGEDSNKITLKLKNGELMNADDVVIHNDKFQQLVKNAAEFETMGARAFVRAYEDYENYYGNKADMTRYSEDFTTMYDVGRTGIKYDDFIKSGQFRATLRSIGEKAARYAIDAGNIDADYKYMHPKNRVMKVKGTKGRVVVENGVEFDLKENAEILMLLDNLSEKVDRDIVISDRFDDGVKGKFNPRNGKIYVSSKIDTNEMLSVALHEAGHSIKLNAPKEWRELEKFVVNYLTSQNKNVSRMIEEQRDIYNAIGILLGKEDALEEIVCNSLMSIASDDQAFQKAVNSTDKTALQKIASAIKKIAAKIKSLLSGKNGISAQAYKPFMENAEALMTLAEKFEKAAESGRGFEVEQKNNTDNGVKNYIEYTEDNKPVVVIEENILKGVPKREWVKTVKNTISSKFSDGIPIKGRLIKVNRITRNEFTNSGNSKYLRDNNSTIYEDKFKTASNLDEIIIASTNYVNEDLNHRRKDSFEEFARGDVLIRVGNNDYSAKVIVGFTNTKQMVLYDVIAFNPVNFKLKKEGTPYGHQKESIRSGMPSNKTISHKSDNVNNNSMQQNENNAEKNDDVIDDGSSGNKYAIDDEKKTYNEYSFDAIKKLIKRGQEYAKEYSTFEELMYAVEVPMSAVNLIGLGFENPDYIPKIGTFYRIGEPVFDIYEQRYKSSYNFAEDRREAGVSVVTSKWLNSLKSVFWGADDEKISKLGVYKITGVILPYVGGDDEITVLPLDFAKKTSIKTRTGLERAVKKLSKNNSTVIDDGSGSIKYAIDDEYEMFDDLIEGETEEQRAARWHEEYENYLKYNPEQALMMVYNSNAKIAEQALKIANLKLDEKRLERAIKRVWSEYHINAKSEPFIFDNFKKIINEFVSDVRENKVSYGESFENFVFACKESLQFSALEDHSYDNFRTELKAICKNGLVINEYEEAEIKEIYGNFARYRNSLFGKCTVRLARNVKNVSGNKTGQRMDDIIADLGNRFGEMLPADTNSLEGLQLFEKLVNKYWQPQYINPYISGYSEDINTAAIQMAYDMSNSYIAEMSKQIVNDNKADKQQLREITKLARQAKENSDQLAKAKAKAVKDKYEKQIEEDKNRYDKKIKRLQDNLDKERKNGLKRASRTEQQIYKLRKQRAQLEEQNKRQRVIIREGFAPIRDHYLEKKRETVLRNRLGIMLNSLTKRLDGKANNNEYIPETLKQPILNVLSSFAVDPGKTKYGKQKPIPGYYGEYRRINQIGNAVTTLAQKYSTLEKDKNNNEKYAFIDIEGLAYKEPVKKALGKLSELLENKNVYQLDVYDLEAVVDTMELLDQTLKDAVSVIIDGQKIQIEEAAKKAVGEVENVNFSKDVKKFSNNMLNSVLSIPREIRNAFVATSLDPLRYGKLLSGYHEEYVTYKIFRDVHDGDKKRIRILEKAMLEVQRTLSEYENKEIEALQKKDVTEFDLRDIETNKRVKITQGILLAIYLTDKQADGHRHMINDQWNSYTVVPDVDSMNNVFNNIKGKNSSGDKFHKIRLTESDIEQINKYVDSNSLLKDLAKAISSVYNEMLPDEINAVSMAKYGKRIATVKNYYPLHVYKDGAKFSDKNFEAEFNDIRMKSRGFTKQREFSYSPIMIDDVLKTFTRHVHSVSEWCGLLIPIENFKRVYNSGNGMNTMHEAVVKKFGGSAEHYIEKLMGDLQKQRDGIDDNMFVKIQQKYMGAVLMLNPGAAVKQMAAFPLANKYFGHVNVSKSVVMGAVKGKELCEVYSKYTPYLWYRAEGNGTIVGETSRQAGFYGKATDVLDIMGKMDRYVVNSLLYAAEQYIKKTTDLKPGTEEFYKEVARQYEKVIDESQPNNMITSKPQFIRNNVLRTLSMNAFMSQTMAMGNGVIDSFMEWRARAYDYKVSKNAESKAAKHAALKRFLQHCVGVLESAALLSLLSLLSAFGYHKWDDFKNENGNVTFGKISGNMFEYFLDGVFGSFAWGKQLYEFIDSWVTGDTYYGLEVMSLSNINDIAKDIQKGNYMSLATMLGDCIGLPASNAYRIARSVTAYVNDMMYGNGNIIISNRGFNDVNFDNLPSMMITALQNGDKKKAEYYEDMLKEHLMDDNGKSEKEAVKTIKNKIVSVLADGEEVGEIAKFKYNGELKNYENGVNKLVKKGFDSVDIKKAVNKAISNVKSDMRENNITDEESAVIWLENQGFNEHAAKRIWNDYNSGTADEAEEIAGALDESSENDESTKYAYDDLWDSLISGDENVYNKIYKAITTADGKLTDKAQIEKKQKSANSAMKSTNRTDKLWAEYVEAVQGSDSAKVQELRNILVKIYGSWDKAMEALKKYKEKRK